MDKKYNIYGSFAGMPINTDVVAISPRQAKIKAAFNNQIVGPEMGAFMNSRDIKIRRVL